MASKPEPSSDWMRPNLDLQPKRELPKADRERQTLFNESILEMSKEYAYVSSADGISKKVCRSSVLS